MKRKSLLMCLALVLSLATAIGGTLAYLTDTEITTNVMTVGNVKIDLLESERVNQKIMTIEDNLQDYTQDKPLYPAVVADDFNPVQGELWSSEHVVGLSDKIVRVENTGSSEAYFRTVVAFQKLPDMSKLIINWNETDYKVSPVMNEVTMTNGVTYVMYEAVYQGKLMPGETSAPSLLQMYLDPTATNETVAGVNGDYSILVAAQAMQTTNFDEVVEVGGYEAALDKAFGEVEKVNPWGDYTFEGEPEPVWVNSVEEFKTTLDAANDGDTIGLMPGTYTFNETINVDKAVTVLGFGSQPSILENVVFDVDSSSADHVMDASFENLHFKGASRIVVGNRSHHNGVGGPDALPTTKLTVKNSTAETAFDADTLAGGKGQFIYLAATYTTKLDLTLDGNTFVNAHTIADEDASPVVNGNGTVIQNVTITNNTFGSVANPCDRYAVKFARRANGTTINISNNTVYGATTAEKDFYLLDLWQSGSNVQNDLTVNLTGNKINCTPNAGRQVYAAYIEKTVKGENFVIGASKNTMDEILYGDSTTPPANVVDAVLINTAEGLAAFAKEVNEGNSYSGKTVMLTADIDLNNVEWTPIGKSEKPFSGTFDGKGHTISNLKISGNNSNVGLFGFTTNGEVRNLTVHNAAVSGRLNVGVVVGTPYTSRYTNINVTGLVKVDGFSYVGGVGGKNVYADWTDITVDVDEGSYVKAMSVENSNAYRTYVGGVVGFRAEGNITMKNVTSNIDVIGSTCDVGGIAGIAHYGNTFENCSSSGNVTLTNATDDGDQYEIGGIAGVWMNSASGDVTFTDCSFTGKLSVTKDANADLTSYQIVGSKYYSNSDAGNLIIN